MNCNDLDFYYIDPLLGAFLFRNDFTLSSFIGQKQWSMWDCYCALEYLAFLRDGKTCVHIC